MKLFILLLLCASPAILFMFLCFHLMDRNKNQDGYNIYNSSLAVQCDANEKCSNRHTSSCSFCKHNCGMQEDKNCFERT